MLREHIEDGSAARAKFPETSCRSAWAHEYSTLNRQQQELESALHSTLSDAAPYGARKSAQDTQETLLANAFVSQCASSASRQQHAEQRGVVRTAKINALLGLRDNRTNTFPFLDPASPATLLAALPTDKTAAQSEFRGVVANVRRDLQMEASALEQELNALEPISCPCVPTYSTCPSSDGWDRLPFARRLSMVPAEVVVYTGSAYEEEMFATEERYEAFLAANGGPSLGWPEELHNAFLRVAHKVQASEANAAQSNSGAVSARGVGGSGQPAVSLFVSAPLPPPASLPLLEAAKQWFFMLVPIPEVERHVELYTQQQELLHELRRRRVAAELAAEQEAACTGPAGGRSARTRKAAEGATLVVGAGPPVTTDLAVCEVPWCREEGGQPRRGYARTSGKGGSYADPALEAAIAKRVTAAQKTRALQEEQRRRVEAWRSAKTAKEAAAQATAKADALAERKAKQQAFKRFQEEQRRRNHLGLLPCGVSGRDGDSGERVSASDGEADEAARELARRRREVRRLRQEGLQARWQRDLEMTKERRARLHAVKAYESTHTKAAVGARYLRRQVSPGAGLSTGTVAHPVSEGRPRTNSRLFEATATRTQHVLPDWETLQWNKELGERGKWLSPAEQERLTSHAGQE